MSDTAKTQNPINRDQQARAVQERLSVMERDYLAQRLQLLESSFPDVVADARRFIEGASALPWEFASAFVGGELEEIQEHYQVQSSRHRPSTATISPITDLFYEAAELLYA